MEDGVKVFLQYGVVGAVALVAFFLYWRSDNENKMLRDRLEAAAKESATTREARISALVDTFTTRLTELDSQHHEQEDELTDRLIKASETYAERIGTVLEKVALLVDSVNRRRG